ncbi:hypothetical protein BC937DRAFT_87738 [Endogone sp. FLAS-F59071]|nr:hypothetical protein BC937DRAFT_87738 [Endogone sp. FLAS-F59071]|eukprot:RUS22695.1 hypothetical protein BC937DRAFT_87738 [Endogone sp. FLAS-F59071]
MKFLTVAALLALATVAVAKPKAPKEAAVTVKSSTTVAAATSSASSAAPAATSAAASPYSAACTAYLSELQTNTTLAQCRTLISSGLQTFAAGSSTVDPSAFLSTLQTYCSQPRCDNSVYSQVLANFKTNCANDLATVKVDDGLGSAIYEWYLSGPQHDAICLADSSKSLCWADIITSLANADFVPYNSTKQKDLADYTLFFMPVTSTGGLPSSIICQTCLIDYANIFNSWLVNNPAPMNLNMAGLTSASLQTSLAYFYQSNCQVALSTTSNGTATASASGTAASGSPSSSTSSTALPLKSDAASLRNTAFGAVVALVILSFMMV